MSSRSRKKDQQEEDGSAEDMNRHRLLAKLHETKCFSHVDGSTGYGVSGVLYHVHEWGVEWLGSMTSGEVHECPVLSREEYKEANLKIKKGKEDNLDEEVVQMIKAGCRPGVQYWRLGHELLCGDDPEFYGSYDEVLDAIEVGESSESTVWEDMDTEELEDWLEIVHERYPVKQRKKK